MYLKLAIPTLILVSLFQAHTAYRVVCVYTNWAQYRPDGGKFLPEDIDAHLCTHIIYVYAKLKGSRLEAVEWNDEDSRWSEGMFSRVNNLKQTNPELKTLLGVGGWMMGSKGFSRMAASRGSRRMFAQSSVKFLRDRGFDGLTIDWQHPTMRGGRPRDRENFSLLLKELRTAFDDDGKSSGLPSLLLAAGVSASKQVIEKAYEIDNITRYTDFLNVMAYDLHGSWDNYTGHPSQLYSRKDELGPTSEINVDTLMKMWIAKTGDRSKLNLGISTYGRTFTLKHPRHNGYQVPSKGPGTQGEFTQQPGMLAYYERCNQYYDASHVWDDSSKASYWVQGDQWIAGEDVQSVKAKTIWAKCNLIGGIMFSSLDMDDFGGFYCSGEPYPLLNTVQRALMSVIRREQCVRQKTIRHPPFPTGSTPTTTVSVESTTFDLSLYNWTDLEQTTTVSTTTVNAPIGQPITTAPKPLFPNPGLDNIFGGIHLTPDAAKGKNQSDWAAGLGDMLKTGISIETGSSNNGTLLEGKGSQFWQLDTTTTSKPSSAVDEILPIPVKTKIPTHSLLEAILSIISSKEKSQTAPPNDQGIIFGQRRATSKAPTFGKSSMQLGKGKTNEPDIASIIFPNRFSGHIRMLNEGAGVV